MTTLGWIVASGLLMAVVALSGSLTFFLSDTALKRILSPAVAFAAGALLGGALLHMLPASLSMGLCPVQAGSAALLGFTAFYILEQSIHAHHCHRAGADCRKPRTHLILVGDAVHNYLDGLAVGAAFMLDIRTGVMAWLAAAAHEVPQELGDFAVLVHSGWSRKRALIFNALSGLTFLAGGLTVYTLARPLNLPLITAFAAGNFLYIGAVDLIPEISRRPGVKENAIHLVSLLAGLGIMFALAHGHSH